MGIIKLVLPVLTAIEIGWLCKKFKLFGLDGLAALKTVISKITLPLVLFNAFFTADYNFRVLIIFIFMYCACGIAIITGFIVRPLLKPYQTYTPFLLTCFEAGMLGYALYGVLVGAEYTHILATVDVGQTMFAYTVFLALLISADGQKPTAKGLILNLIKNPAADGMLLGVLLGLAGIGKLVSASSVSLIYKEFITFLTAPTACIILIAVGYEISFKKELLRPVFITVGLRLLLCALLFAVVSALLFKVIPFDKKLMIALMVMFSLPAPFVIPLFANVKNDGKYISTSLSTSTLCTIVLFIGISAYSMM